MVIRNEMVYNVLARIDVYSNHHPTVAISKLNAVGELSKWKVLLMGSLLPFHSQSQEHLDNPSNHQWHETSLSNPADVCVGL